MLFFIAPSVAQAIENNNADAIDFIARLVDSRKRGMLLVHASKRTYDRTIAALIQQGKGNEADLLKRISKRQQETRGLVKDLTKLVYVSSYAKKLRTIGSKFIFTSPAHINTTQYMYYPVILAENVNDAILYLSVIAENYVTELPTTLRDVAIRGRRRMGGGNTTHVQYTELKNEGLELCLCITDSDRKCPHEGIGETAKLVVDSDHENKSAACSNIVIDVCAAENLLPIDEIRRIYEQGKSLKQIELFSLIEAIRGDEGWRFLPLKNGLSSKDVRSQKASSIYWQARLTELGVELKCCDLADCNCVLVPAVSTKTLSEAVKKENTGWYRHLRSEINADVRSVYDKISRELRSWCCVGKEMRA
jgi:hypothetical protein